MLRPALLVALVALAGGLNAQEQSAKAVELVVAGPPISAEETGQPPLYQTPPPIEGVDMSGIFAQHWSMMGREDLSALTGDSEYRAVACDPVPGGPSGTQAVIATIVERARDHRVVIINESHTLTRHRDFSRQVIAALRAEGFAVLAAETFGNVEGAVDPVDTYADAAHVDRRLGYYSAEPVFGQMLREAKALGYTFKAYEIAYDPNAIEPAGLDEQIAQREQAQAKNLAGVLAAMAPHEKLVVHVGFSHAQENETRRADGFDTSWMAARLKRMTGIDPLTIAQTECRGNAEDVRLSLAPARLAGRFDMIIDHPLESFAFGKPVWRLEQAEAVPIPQALRPVDGPLVIEAFADGEPEDAVPVDRIWMEPGEDLRLALPPGRYRVRAVRPDQSGG